MASHDLIAYVADRRKAGMSDDRIKTILHNTGYEPLEIDEALRAAQPSPAHVAQATTKESAPTAPAAPAGPKGRFAQEDVMGDLERSRKIKTIVFWVIGVILAGGIAYGAYVYFGPPSPQVVMANMFEQLDTNSGFVYGKTFLADASSSSMFGPFSVAQFEEKWTSVPAADFSTLSPSSLASIVSAVAGSMQIVKVLPDEIIDGTSTYHYQYVITKPGLENLAATLETVAQVSSTAQAERIADITSAFALVQSMGGEIWIGKGDYYPRQISFEGVAASDTFQVTATY